MRRYEGMRLPPGTDPVLRNELLKADRFLKQLATALAGFTRTNNPSVVISGSSGSVGGSTIPGLTIEPNCWILDRRLSILTAECGIATLMLVPFDVADIGILVRLLASQTGDAFQIQDSTGVKLASFSSNGSLDIGNSGFSPAPSLGIKVSSATQVGFRVIEAAGQSASLFRFENSAGSPYMEFSPESANTPFRIKIIGSSTNGAGIQFPAARNLGNNIQWSAPTFGPPVGTTDERGTAGARIYLYRDGIAADDNAIGQSATEQWTLADAFGTWVIYTNDGTTAATKRVEWAPNGDMRNYGKVRISKFTVGATNPGGLSATAPSLQLDGNTSGTLTLQAAASTTSHTISLPATAPPAAGKFLRSTSTSATEWGSVANASAAGDVAFTVQGAASQTADLTQWKNSAGAVLSSVESGGQLLINTGSLSTDTFLEVTGNGGDAPVVIHSGGDGSIGSMLRCANGAGTPLIIFAVNERWCYGTFNAGATKFVDPTDETKQFIMDANFISTGTTRTYHWPNFNGRKVVRSDSNIRLTGQTANIGTTTIFTTPAIGLLQPSIYRISVYAMCTTAGSAGTLDVTIGWTDTVGATTEAVVSGLSLAATGRGKGDITVRCNGSTAITYATAITGGAGSPAYDLYIVIEGV